MLIPFLIAASAAVLLALGTLHLIFTFHGNRLHPRDAALKQRMQEVSPVITRETTMWKTWIGFNATHSMSAMLFGLVYGYLALAAPEFLLQSAFLLALGAVTLAAFVVIGRLYFFSVPFRGVVLASLLYFTGLALNIMQGGL